MSVYSKGVEMCDLVLRTFSAIVYIAVPCTTAHISDCSFQIVESSKLKGEKELTEKQEKVLIEIEKCHRRVEEFSEYSDLSLMQQYCKEITL